eukprot:scaffold1223_cov380-Prasinococcus_capsulatus_cf.AAC.6
MLVLVSRSTDWRTLLRTQIGSALGDDTLIADQSPISEELNVAFANHEIVGSVARKFIAWVGGDYDWRIR